MAEYGINDQGFNRKRLDQLLSELNSEMKAIFGDNFNVSPESPDGQVDGVIAESNANLWEIAEAAYNAFNPSAATGSSLSNLVQLNGITRLAATASRAQLTITGTPGVTIPVGSLVSTSDTGDQFATELAVDIGGGGTVLVFASALNTGPISALAGTLTIIDTPVTGWVSVNNVADAAVGTNEETDPDLRARRKGSVGLDAQAVIDAIQAKVADIDGVTRVVVLENDTNAVDGDGVPPKSFLVVVSGGLDATIAEAIWLTKPAGILAFGTTTVSVEDSQGFNHDISFSRPTDVPIYVEVDLTTDGDYPVDGDDLVKQAIVDYANGDLVAGQGFSLGDDVIYSRMYTPINSVPGHSITDLQISKVFPASGVADIAIAATELSSFVLANIVVNS